EWHFWFATLGVVLYITSMWVSGIMQGLMWRAVNSDGTLTYSFVESVQAMHPYYFIRGVGGLIYLCGMILMAYNVYKTIRQGKAYDAPVLAPAH
ncbi:MAG: cbb3-type cytochrome c oxidase subunit I, partial [Arenicellales bacterium]